MNSLNQKQAVNIFGINVNLIFLIKTRGMWLHMIYQLKTKQF